MNAESDVWVWAETPGDYAALCALGRDVGATRVSIVWAGSEAGAQALARAGGADAVLWASIPEDGLFEDAVGAVAVAARERRPNVVLCAVSKRMRLAAARVAAALGTRAVNDAVRVWRDENGGLSAERMVYGGNAFRIERGEKGSSVVLAAGSLLVEKAGGTAGADCACPSSAGGGVPVERLAAAPPSGMVLAGRRPLERDAVNLTAARRVVSVGRGLGKQEDLAVIEELAGALGAEIGCTRPLAEGVNWLPRERYIGVSGAMIKPDLFVAVGVSGQVQHMVGASGARTVVAINKDQGAPVFKQADYGIVGDLYDVAPRLAEALRTEG